MEKLLQDLSKWKGFFTFHKITRMVILYIISALVALLVIVLIIALFLPSRYHIERTIVIPRPLSFVMDRVGDLHFYKQWNPWQRLEPDSPGEITGEPKTPGHSYAWNGKKTGSGSLTLRHINHKHIHFDLEFIRPWKASANDDWHFEEWGTGETKVTWQNSGDLPYPIARLISPIFRKMLEKQFTEGLKNLQELCTQ